MDKEIQWISTLDLRLQAGSKDFQRHMLRLWLNRVILYKLLDQMQEATLLKDINEIVNINSDIFTRVWLDPHRNDLMLPVDDIGLMFLDVHTNKIDLTFWDQKVEPYFKKTQLKAVYQNYQMIAERLRPYIGCFVSIGDCNVSELDKFVAENIRNLMGNKRKVGRTNIADKIAEFLVKEYPSGDFPDFPDFIKKHGYELFSKVLFSKETLKKARRIARKTLGVKC